MGSGDEEMSAQPGAAGETTGMKSTKGTRGTVGTTGSAAHRGTTDDSAMGGAKPRASVTSQRSETSRTPVALRPEFFCSLLPTNFPNWISF